MIFIQIRTISEENKIITVDINGNGDFTNINEAINNSPEKSTIYVKKGVYNEILNIQKELKIISEDKYQTIINPISKENHYAIRLGAQNIVFDGFTISNRAPGIYTNAIRISSDYIKIKNCIIHDNPVGIAVFTSNNIIENCIFYNCKDEGIALIGSTYHICSKNLIKDCTFYNNCDGIELQYSSNNIISNCHLFNNTHTGIDAIASSNNFNKIKDCQIHDNQVHGIYFSDSSDNEINNCEIKSNYDGNIIMKKNSYNNLIIERTENNNLEDKNLKKNYKNFILTLLNNQISKITRYLININ